MYVLTGATGRVGSAVAQRLLEGGAPVRVLVRRPEAADRWVRLGAEARVLRLTDRAALGEAVAGSAGVFAMLPFDLTVDDLDAHADSIIDAIVGAVADQRVPHVVMLSAGGADLAEGTGPITGLHRMEQALLSTGTVLTALRSGHFQEKVGDMLDMARSSGVYPVFAASADVPFSMGATRDLGAVAARALLSPPTASEAVDVIGPSYSERQVAGVLGAALGRDLDVVELPEPAWIPALTDAGFRPHVAASLADLYRADEQGLLAPRGDRSVRIGTDIETTIAGLLAA